MESRNDQAEDLLQGKTMKIYWYILTHGESGIREIQRNLKISSPSTVSYHVNKLVDAGYISKLSTDKYSVIEPVKDGIIKLYFRIGRLMIPRMIFYLSFFAICAILYILLMFSRMRFVVFTEDAFFLLLSACGMLFFLFETYRIWSMKPL